MGVIMSKVGKAVASQSKWVVKTIPKENRELADHLFPFRFTKAGVVGVGGFTAAYGIGTTALNEHKARQIGRIEATPVANTIGRPSMGHDAQIVRDIPNQTKTHGVNKFIDSIPGVQGKRYDDMGAGGDLVLAMHELRSGGL